MAISNISHAPIELLHYLAVVVERSVLEVGNELVEVVNIVIDVAVQTRIAQVVGTY